jgi:hypothetical protein
LEALGIQKVAIFYLWPFGIYYGHLEYITAIWYISRPFGIYYGHLVYFKAIWYISRPFGKFQSHLVI